MLEMVKECRSLYYKGTIYKLEIVGDMETFCDFSSKLAGHNYTKNPKSRRYSEKPSALEKYYEDFMWSFDQHIKHDQLKFFGWGFDGKYDSLHIKVLL